MTSPTTNSQAARLDQCSGFWAILAPALNLAISTYRADTMAAGKQEAAGQAGVSPALAMHPGSSLEVDRDGVATITIAGPITKGRVFRTGTDTDEIIAHARAAMTEDRVRGVELFIDSPGGTVNGVAAAAEAIRDLAAVKPVHTFIEDVGASAGYWLAAQGHRITAGETAIVGSIGTLLVVSDWSGLFNEAGIKIHVIGSAPLKGAGVFGSEITDEQLADFQRIVMELNDRFLAGLSGRFDADELAAIADGRVHVGPAALAVGLVDEIGTREHARNALLETIQAGGPRAAQAATKETTTMAKQPSAANVTPAATAQATTETPPPEATAATPQAAAPASPATFAEIKSSCAGATPEFICECQEKALTTAQARDAWVAHQNATIAAQQKQLEAAAETTEASAKTPTGSGVVGGAAAATAEADPVASFDAAVADKVAAGMSRARAVSATVKEDKERHDAYVAAAN